MSNDKRIVVKGGGKNLYKVSEYDGWFYAYKVREFSSDDSLGKTRNLKDALDLIKSHSGKEIEKID